jgi:hypothetical protein
MQLWDWAIMLLLLASLGAAGLVGMVFSGSDNPFLQQLFLHQFLDLFAVGWFTLAVLGVLWAQVEQFPPGSRPAAPLSPLPRWLPTMSLAMLLAPTFLLGVSPAVLPAHLFWLAAAANVGAAVLLAVHIVLYLQAVRNGVAGALAPRLPGLHLLTFGSLGVVLGIALLLLIPGVWADSASGPLRIFYLHDLLLGWISSALLILIDRKFNLVPWPQLRLTIYALWEVGVVLMLAALLGLGFTRFLPVSALSLLQLAAWSSALVAAAAVLLLIAALSPRGSVQTAEHEVAPVF